MLKRNIRHSVFQLALHLSFTWQYITVPGVPFAIFLKKNKTLEFCSVDIRIGESVNKSELNIFVKVIIT